MVSINRLCKKLHTPRVCDKQIPVKYYGMVWTWSFFKLSTHSSLIGFPPKEGMVWSTAGSHWPWHSQPLLKSWGSFFHPETKRSKRVRPKDQVHINKAFSEYYSGEWGWIDPVRPITTKGSHLKRLFWFINAPAHLLYLCHLYNQLNLSENNNPYAFYWNKFDSSWWV